MLLGIVLKGESFAANQNEGTSIRFMTCPRRLTVYSEMVIDLVEDLDVLLLRAGVIDNEECDDLLARTYFGAHSFSA